MLHVNSDAFFNRLRKKEYFRLDERGHVYLDYTGGNICPQSLLDKHFNYLTKAIYGNPHSSNPASLLSERMVNAARERVLDFFNAPNYYCVFTANASAALQIVGECYPFFDESEFLLTADNHNSVNGIREYCQGKGGHYSYCPMNAADLSIDEITLNKKLHGYKNKRNKLFAYPAQSNASGVRHSLKWIKIAQDQGWDVLLDAAAFIPTSALDLSEFSPDYVTLSFYKMFGYPTGIGCLLIRKSKFHQLKKAGFSGGTVSLSAVGYDGYFLKPNYERFENGTVNYLGIPAITYGLNFINTIGVDNISCRITELSEVFLQSLEKLRHSDGRALVKLYGPKNTRHRGGTFLMNFFDVSGQQYPCQHIEQLANADMISLRTGCFCNPGIDELNNALTPDQLGNYFSGRDGGDYDEMIRIMGILRGAVRVSIGIPTTGNDIKKFVQFAVKLLDKNMLENMPTSNQCVAHQI